jgi:CheY-like chemotaxis protein
MVPRMAKEKYSVLLADDSEDDILFIRRALRHYPRFVIVGEVHDGEEAISYLSGHDPFNDRDKYPFPDVMLLDLKMPKKSGHDVLQWLKEKSFGSLFVVVVSGSFLPEDVQRSLALGADAYYKKNALREEQENLIHSIEQALDVA